MKKKQNFFRVFFFLFRTRPSVSHRCHRPRCYLKSQIEIKNQIKNQIESKSESSVRFLNETTRHPHNSSSRKKENGVHWPRSKWILFFFFFTAPFFFFCSPLLIGLSEGAEPKKFLISKFLDSTFAHL